MHKGVIHQALQKYEIKNMDLEFDPLQEVSELEHEQTPNYQSVNLPLEKPNIYNTMQFNYQRQSPKSSPNRKSHQPITKEIDLNEEDIPSMDMPFTQAPSPNISNNENNKYAKA